MMHHLLLGLSITGIVSARSVGNNDGHVFAFSPPSPFAGYQLYPATDVSKDSNLGSWTTGSDPSVDEATKFLCDQTPECQFHNDVSMKGWSSTSPSNNTHSYISVTKCGQPSRRNGTIDDSTCAAPASAAGYFSCPAGTDGAYIKIATYELPPFLVAQSCEKDADCVAFTIDYAGSTGTIYSVAFNVNATLSTYHVKLFAPAIPTPTQQKLASRVAIAVNEAKFSGFHEQDNTDLGVLGAATVAYGGCDAGGPANVITPEALKELCMLSQHSCRAFIDAPPPAGWNVWQFTANPNVTSYISNSVCEVTPGSCDLGGWYLKCNGLDISKAPVKMETYDLPPNIIEQACRVKNCHFFTVKIDGSGGTLYEFAPSNTTASYVRLD